MKVTVEVLLIIVAAFSLPNLFYRAEFNIPILVFAALLWQRRVSTAAHLIVLSWLVQLYRLIALVVTDDKDLQEQKKPFLLSLTILAFVLKCILIVYLIMNHEEFRKQVSIPGWLTSMGKAIKGQE